jgi:hypothetical protein
MEGNLAKDALWCHRGRSVWCAGAGGSDAGIYCTAIQKILMAWPEELLVQVDAEAARRAMNRSEFVRSCVVKELAGLIVREPLPDMPAVMNVVEPAPRWWGTGG